MPELVEGHLHIHRNHGNGEWTCTSCGKQFLRGQWGFSMLLMHMQGRGNSAYFGIIDLRKQYSSMSKLED
jgi:hypothetical protein